MADLDLTVKGGEEFSRLARRLYRGVHTDLEKEVKAAVRKAARPLSRSVRRSMPDYLPDRYVFEDLIPSTQLKTEFHPAGVTISMGASGKVKQRALPAIEAGVLRHPVYGHHVRPWVNQAVTPGFFHEPLEAGSPFVQAKALEAIQSVAAEIAGG